MLISIREEARKNIGRNYYNQDEIIYSINKRKYCRLSIPVKITNLVGMFLYTRIEPLYDTDNKYLVLRIVKEKKKGYKLNYTKSKSNNDPPRRLYLIFPYIEKLNMPRQKLIITNYEIKSGLVIDFKRIKKE